MRIAVSSQNKKSISGHAGKTSRFWIYHVEGGKVASKELIELKREDILHIRFHESEHPYAPHPVLESEAIITGGAGPGFFNRMAVKNIGVIITKETDPDRAVEKYLDGTIHRMPPGHNH